MKNFIQSISLISMMIGLMSLAACSGPSEKEIQGRVDQGNANLEEMSKLEKEFISDDVYMYWVTPSAQALSKKNSTELQEAKTKLERYKNLATEIIAIVEGGHTNYDEAKKKKIQDKIEWANERLNVLESLKNKRANKTSKKKAS